MGVCACISSRVYMFLRVYVCERVRVNVCACMCMFVSVYVLLRVYTCVWGEARTAHYCSSQVYAPYTHAICRREDSKSDIDDVCALDG